MTLLVLPFGTTRQLGSQSDAQLADAAALQAVHALGGTSAAQAGDAAAVRVKHHVAGAAAVVSADTAAARVTHRLAGSAAAQSTASGALRVRHHEAASAASAETAAGAVRVHHHLAGSAASSLTATQRGAPHLAGSAAAHLTVSGSLRVSRRVERSVFGGNTVDVIAVAEGRHLATIDGSHAIAIETGKVRGSIETGTADVLTGIYGNPVTLTRVFSDADDALYDPGAVTLVIEHEGKTKIACTPTRLSLGTWRFVFTPPAPGRYIAQWKSTGPATVRETPFGIQAASF